MLHAREFLSQKIIMVDKISGVWSNIAMENLGEARTQGRALYRPYRANLNEHAHN